MMARFRNFYNLEKKSRLSLKRRSAFRTGIKIYLSEKKFFGVRCTLIITSQYNKLVPSVVFLTSHSETSGNDGQNVERS